MAVSRNLRSARFRAFLGFTLFELLVVIAIIAVLAVVAIPAINSLSKSSGRKAAISNLLGALEQARAQAIKDSQPTYVVFVTFSAATTGTTDRYNYRSYALYEDDPANTANPKQLTNWKTLPTGVAIRSASLTNLTDPTTLAQPLNFSFTPETNATAVFRLIKYNSAGQIEAPGTGNIIVSVFEGRVNGDASAGTEIVTSGKNSANQPAAVQSITIARLTGRAVRS